MDLVLYGIDAIEDAVSESFAEKHDMKFFKTSALEGKGIDDALNYMIEATVEHKYRPKAQGEKQ